MIVKCDYCKIEFEKRNSEIKNSNHNFCCLEHFHLYNKKPENLSNVICSHCGKPIYRKPSQIKKAKSGLFFCSSECKIAEQRIGGKLEIDFYGSANRNNTCRMCGVSIRNGKTGLCKSCLWIQMILNTGKLTKIELVKGSYTPRNRYQCIRNHAHNCMKKIYKHEIKCAVCGYMSHVELCHKKPIGDFPDTALLSEINSESNLVYLCPNHHWSLITVL